MYNTKLTATKNLEHCPFKRRRYLSLFITFLNSLQFLISTTLFADLQAGYSCRDWALNIKQHPKLVQKKSLILYPVQPPNIIIRFFSYNNCKRTVCPNELLRWRLNGLLIFYHKANNHFSVTDFNGNNALDICAYKPWTLKIHLLQVFFSFHSIISEPLQLLHSYKNVMSNW